jgi:2-methylcitrate dehydratase PrpD
MGLARELAERIVALRYDDLPPEAIHWSKIAVLDTIGVMLAGAREEAPRLVDAVLDEPADGPALIFGSSRRARALDAALVNGTAAHALDFDNTASSLGGHVSAVMVPALLAAGETGRYSGRDLLVAHTVGFETGRIGRAVNPLHSEKGWHPTATLGVFAVTAACAHLLRLDADQTERALALSTSLAAGTKANFGTMTKPLHAGQCARGGLMAVMLARKNFSANVDAFEHKQGYFALFNEGGEPVNASGILHGWGAPFDIVSPGASYKLYPCCYSTHAAMQAALDLVERHGTFDPSSVERIDSYTSERALVHTDRPDPNSDLEAKFSVQYCVSRALMQGRVVLDDFEGGAYRDPAAQAMLRKVRAAPYTGPVFCVDDPFDAEVKVTLTDGRVLGAKVDRPLGRTAENPIGREALDAKFIDCASRVLTPAAAAALCRRIWALERIESVQALTSMCEPSDVTRGEPRAERTAV